MILSIMTYSLKLEHFNPNIIPTQDNQLIPMDLLGFDLFYHDNIFTPQLDKERLIKSMLFNKSDMVEQQLKLYIPKKYLS